MGSKIEPKTKINKEGETVVRISLEISEQLFADLETAAKRDFREFSAEVRAALTAFVNPPSRKKG
jgi:metal-responsive CopG/Arc/MetJ family transcriptional regulator